MEPVDFVSPTGFTDRSIPTLIAAAKITNGFINRYLANDASKGKWRVLGGNVGCGKTHLARTVCRAAMAQCTANDLKKNHRVAFTPTCAWVKWIDAGSDEMSDKDFGELLKNHINPATLVIIDDIGAESDRYKSGVGRQRLLRVLEHAEKKWLFCTTNIQPDDYETRYDFRIASRLKGAVSIWIDAPDYRPLKRGAP